MTWGANNELSRLLREAREKFAPDKEKSGRTEVHHPSSVTAAQQIGWFAHTSTGEDKSFVVNAGDGAPTVVKGWPKVAIVPRMGRVSLTVREGWDPIEMTVPVLFEAVALTNPRQDVEADILILEWMAGRSPHPVGGETQGEPPYVEIYAVNSAGVQVPLVLLQYQGEPGRSQQWFITDIAFDPGALRVQDAKRVRQAATITLLEIVSTPGVVKKNRAAREEVKEKFKLWHSNKAENTIRRIAAGHHVPSSWKAILKANPKLGTNAEKPLISGTPVKIPETVFRQVPK